jgi:hypothetical protein
MMGIVAASSTENSTLFAPDLESREGKQTVGLAQNFKLRPAMSLLGIPKANG